MVRGRATGSGRVAARPTYSARRRGAKGSEGVAAGVGRFECGAPVSHAGDPSWVSQMRSISAANAPYESLFCDASFHVPAPVPLQPPPAKLDLTLRNLPP